MSTYHNIQSDQEMLKAIYFTLTTMQINTSLKYSNTFQFLCYLIIPKRPHY